MKCQNLFSGKNNINNINLSFAEYAHEVKKVKGQIKSQQQQTRFFFFFLFFFFPHFSEKMRLDISYELSARQRINVKPIFSENKNKLIMPSATESA